MTRNFEEQKAKEEAEQDITDFYAQPKTVEDILTELSAQEAEEHYFERVNDWYSIPMPEYAMGNPDFVSDKTLREWCEQFKAEDWDQYFDAYPSPWNKEHQGGNRWLFRNYEDAVLFKLTWGGS